MPSNNFSFSLANRQWDLFEKGVYRNLFIFDKVPIYLLCYRDMLLCYVFPISVVSRIFKSL